MRSIDYIDLLKKTKGWNDAETARALGLSKQAVSNYRNTPQEFNDPIAIEVAELLGISPQKVLAEVHAARSKDKKVKKAWEKIASTAAMVVVSLMLQLQPTDAQAKISTTSDLSSYRLCAIK